MVSMKKIIIFFMFAFIFSSCTVMKYYEQTEFLIAYDELIEYFDKTLEDTIKKKDLKKLDKRFYVFERQLYEKNENYVRINKDIVDRYSKDIRYYRGIIEDLKD